MKLTRNNIKLSFRKPKFQINKNRGTVKCVLDYEIVPPYDYDGEFAPLPGGFRSVEAVTVCQPSDTFDECKGKKIALARAENLAYMCAYTELSTRIDFVTDEDVLLHNMVKNFYEKTKRCTRHNKKYIKHLAD